MRDRGLLCRDNRQGGCVPASDIFGDGPLAEVFKDRFVQIIWEMC